MSNNYQEADQSDQFKLLKQESDLSLEDMLYMLFRPFLRFTQAVATSLTPVGAQQQTRSLTSISEKLQAALTPASCGLLQRQGWLVLDGVLGTSRAETLRTEIQSLYHSGSMHKNHTHLVRGGQTHLLEKSHVHEAELTLDDAVKVAAPVCAELDADSTFRTLLSLFLPQLTLDSQAMKLQHNSGSGGCFPMHFDSDETLDQRKLTAILYLNAGWSAEDGGALRLYPFPSPPVDILPVQDRLVLFSTPRMLHRVMPSQRPRTCLTIWFSHSRRRGSAPQQPPLAELQPSGASSKDPGAVSRFLLSPAVRQHTCKYAYREEWATSIEESHPPSPARDETLARHWHEVGIIKTALAKYLDHIEQPKLESTQSPSHCSIKWF